MCFLKDWFSNSTGMPANNRCLMKRLIVISALMTVLLHTPAVLADIYMYIDSDGVIHFTNTPTSTDYKLYIRERPQSAGTMPVDHRKYDDLIRQASRKYGVDFSLVKAVIQVESSFNAGAVSKKGAKGLMQIMPQNYATLNVTDPFDPSQNIMGGTLYLRRLIDRYDNKIPLVLAAYNAGPNAVDRYRTVPPFSETQQYVEKVMKLYSTIKNT